MSARTLSFLLLSLLLWSCGEQEPPPNVLIVTFDTTRADRIGCYGHDLANTPAIDALAARGVRFERAYSQVPLTLPSHATLLSGVHPQGHGLRVNFQGVLNEEVSSLAEVMSAAGYRTGAFVAAWVLNADFGLDRGFEVYDDLREQTVSADQQAERPASEVVDAALHWIAADDERPMFCWVHFYDPHDPYAPPEGATPPGGDAYDGEIAYTDAQLARLLDGLGERGMLDDTLVVVSADHGESMGEHGEITHGLFVYESATRVPLVIAGPSVSVGEVVDTPVGLVDLHPTLVELCRLAPTSGVEGRSLVPALRGEGLADEPVYFESEYSLRSYGWAPLRGLVSREWRYIEAPQPELYRLLDDPGELDNRIESDALAAQRMRDALYARMASGARRDAGAVQLGPEDSRQLSSLGYVAGRAGEIELEELGDLRDPKEVVHVLRGTSRAKRLSDQGRHEEVVALLEPLLEESPESDEIWSLVAKSYFELRRFEESRAAYEKSLRSIPDQPERLVMFGDALAALGRPAEALVQFERALDLAPELGQAHSRAGTAHARAGRFDEAFQHFRSFAKLEPRSPNARFNLANVLLAKGRFAEGVVELEAALDIDPDCVPALRAMPEAQRRAGRPAAELVALERASAALPDDALISLRLAWRLAIDPELAGSRGRDALALARRFVPEDARDPGMLDVLAACMAANGDFELAASIARRAAELAPPGPAREAIEGRAALYRAGRGYAESP